MFKHSEGSESFKPTSNILLLKKYNYIVIKYIKGDISMVTKINDLTKKRGIQGALQDKRGMYKATKKLSMRVLRKNR